METKQKFEKLREFFYVYNDGVTARAWHFEDSDLRLTLTSEGTGFIEIAVTRRRNTDTLELKVGWSAWGSVSTARFEEALRVLNKAHGIIQHAQQLIG